MCVGFCRFWRISSLYFEHDSPNPLTSVYLTGVRKSFYAAISQRNKTHLDHPPIRPEQLFFVFSHIVTEIFWIRELMSEPGLQVVKLLHFFWNYQGNQHTWKQTLYPDITPTFFFSHGKISTGIWGANCRGMEKYQYRNRSILTFSSISFFFL